MACVQSKATVIYTLFMFLPLVPGYNVTYVTSVLDTYCPGSDSCEDTDAPCLTCSCDHYCNQKGNCCPSVEEKRTATLPGYGNDEPAFSCISPRLSINSGTKILDTLGIYMTATCPSGLSDERCTNSTSTDLIESLPHTCNKTGIHYKNIYCGTCNGATDMLPWKPYVSCSKTNVVKADRVLFPNSVAKTFQAAIESKDSNCGVEFLPPDNIPISQDLCTREQFNRTCEKNDDTITEACEQLTIPYYFTANNETTIYANPFCFLCQKNGGFSDNERQGAIELPHADDNILIGVLNHRNEHKHDTDELLHEVENLVKWYSINPTSCDEGYLYDPYNRECRPWYCPTGTDLVDGSCVPVFVELKKATYELRLNVVVSNDSVPVFRTLDKYNLTLNLLSDLFGNEAEVETEVVLIAEKGSEDVLYILSLLKVVSRISGSIATHFGIERLLNNYYFPVDRDALTLNVSLAVGAKVEMNPFSRHDLIVFDLPSYAAYGIIYKSSVTDANSLRNYPLLDKLAFCVQIALESYEILDFNDIIDVHVSDVRLFIGEFVRAPGEERVRVCFTDYMRRAAEKLPHREKPVVHSPQAIVSVICNLLSITGLTATVLTYFIFGELRSIPGKNNMMLAIHLLIAQCLYQFGIQQNENLKLCMALGVFIHLFWLTSILWMNACTLHMFRTFVTGQSYRSYRALDPQVCCYALYCYTVAVIIIAINIGVSMYKSNGEKIGYGGEVCYISTPVMVGWTFALPVGVIIILNMGFFFAVVYQISASTMRRRGKSNDRANTIIYMKLSTLTGVTWVFGYLYLWTDFIPLEYIFIVLNAGQGVLIFISFICTTRIIRLYQDLFSKIHRSIRHRNCCAKVRSMSDGGSKAIEMNVAKLADLKSHSSSKTLDTAVATCPNQTGIPVALPGGTVVIKPVLNGLAVIGTDLVDGNSEAS